MEAFLLTYFPSSIPQNAWYTPVPLKIGAARTREIVLRLQMMARRIDRAILLGRGARKSAPDWQVLRWSHQNIPSFMSSRASFEAA
jgi:hypothetical protein